MVGRLTSEVRDAAKYALAARLDPPVATAHAHRFFWGLALPFAVVRATFRHPDARARWLRFGFTQLAVLFAVAAVITLTSGELSALIGKPSVGQVIALLSSAYVTLCFAEWTIIALARDYHDALSFAASEATGVVGEPLTAPPRVRVDFKWMWRKLKKRIRGLLLFVSGLPIAALALFLPVVGDAVYAVLSGAWALYWVGVFAIGQSHLAWDRPDAHAPWFLRAMDSVAKVPVVGWIPRLYARLWRRVTLSVVPPCATFEETTYEAAGLAVTRAIAGVPGVYMFFRPAFSVAAAHAIVARRAG